MKVLLGLIPFLLFLQGLAESARPETLVRRLYIDLFERLPSPVELIKGANSVQADNYDTLVDAMLKDEEFISTLAKKVALHYSPDLKEKRNGDGEIDAKFFRRFIRMQNLIKTKYLAESDFRLFIRDLTSGKGLSSATPALYFYDREESLEDLTGRYADRVLGVPLKCAQCHNHREYKDLLKLDFWGLATFFKNTRIIELDTHDDVKKLPDNNKFLSKTYRSLMDEGDYKYFKYWYDSEKKGESILQGQFMEIDTQAGLREITPDTLLKVNQLFLLEEKYSLDYLKIPNPDDDKEFYRPLLIGEIELPSVSVKPREFLAGWVTSENNPFLKKSVTNWVANWIFGRGFKMPLTDIYGSGLNDELLKEYSEFLKNSNFDLKKLIKKMLTSDFYKAASPVKTDMAKVNQFKERALRLVPATAISRTLALEAELTSEENTEVSVFGRTVLFNELLTNYSELISYFPQNEESGQGAYETNVSQSMYLMFNQRIRAQISRIAAKESGDESFLVKIWVLKFFGRTAKKEEVDFLVNYIKSKPEARQESLLNVLKVILNSPELRYY